MIVERLTQMPIAEFYGNRIWRRIGTEHDGYMGLNKQGHANCFGFMNSTLRDFARFGMAFTPSQTKFDGGRIIPDDVIRNFRRACDRKCIQKAQWARQSRKLSGVLRA